jgi:hypothetical protein
MKEVAGSRKAWENRGNRKNQQTVLHPSLTPQSRRRMLKMKSQGKLDGPGDRLAILATGYANISCKPSTECRDLERQISTMWKASLLFETEIPWGHENKDRDNKKFRETWDILPQCLGWRSPLEVVKERESVSSNPLDHVTSISFSYTQRNELLRVI